MSVKKKKVSKYAISNIDVYSDLISWEKHSVPTSGIAQIWIGGAPAEPFPVRMFLILLFIALSGPYILSIILMTASLAGGAAIWFFRRRTAGSDLQVNMKLYSGDIISFTSANADSVTRFYTILKEAAGKNISSEVHFDADGLIEELSEESTSEEASSVMDIKRKTISNEPLIEDLQKLYLNYTKKADVDSEVLTLINGLAPLILSGDREGIKAALSKFVTLGLIVDCNELGLDSLLQEIKSRLY